MGLSPLAELVFVKLGGSVITDKTRAAKALPERIGRLAGEIRAAQDARPDLAMVLGHGSGSFGHTVGQKYGIHRGIDRGQSWWGYAETAAAAARLNRIVTDILLTAGVPVVSIQPSATARCCKGELKELTLYPIRQALEHALVPLLYGDVALDDSQGCTIVSTEQVLAYLAQHLRPARIVMVGRVDGVYDRDPLRDAEARPLRRITPDSFPQVRSQLGGSHATDVTGGMLTKVSEMVSLVAQGCTERVHLISGLRKGALTRVLLDAQHSQGTMIERQEDANNPTGNTRCC